MPKSMRTFYTLSITQTFSLIGTQMSGLAIGLWVFSKTGQTTPLLLVAVFETLPSMLVGSLGGFVADRFRRKWLLMIGDAGQALPTLLLLISFSTHHFELWQLYTAVLVQAIFGMIQQPAAAASISLMVPPEQLDRANTISQLTMPTAGLIAPILTGFLYVAIDVQGIILIDLLTFLVAVVVVSTLTIPQPPKTQEGQAHSGSMWREVRGGFVFLWGRRMLLVLILFATLINFLLNGGLSLATPYVLTLTNSKPAVGILLGVLNLGMLVGGVGFGIVGVKPPRIHAVLRGIMFMALFTMLYGVARSPFTLGIAMFFVLLVNPMVNAVFMSLLQVKTPPDLHGRVFALVRQLAMLATPLSFILTGVLVDHVLEPAVGKWGWDRVAWLVGDEAGSGMGLLIFASGAILMISTLLIYALPRIRSIESDLPDYMPQSTLTQEPPSPSLPGLEGAFASD